MPFLQSITNRFKRSKKHKDSSNSGKMPHRHSQNHHSKPNAISTDPIGRSPPFRHLIVDVVFGIDKFLPSFKHTYHTSCVLTRYAGSLRLPSSLTRHNSLDITVIHNLHLSSQLPQHLPFTSQHRCTVAEVNLLERANRSRQRR